MDFLFNTGDSDEVNDTDKIRDSIRKIKHNLDKIYEELDELEESVKYKSTSFEDGFRKKEKKFEGSHREEESRYDEDEEGPSFNVSDFTRKIEEYDKK